jgi:GTP-binding protein YchF
LSKELLEKVLDSLEKGKNVNTIDLDENEKKSIKSLQLLSAKPVLYVANIDESSHNSNLELVTKFANKENIDIVAICANVEAQIVDLTEEEKQEFLADIGQKKSGLDILTQSAYKALGLQTYFTAGPKDVHAWTIKIGDTAPKAAGKIHSDFEKGFIRAEIIPFNDFIYYNGRNDAKKAGKLRSEGKNYIVQDGDIINFLFNV